MKPLDLSAPQAALDNARAIRKQMCGRSPWDQERREALERTLGLLRESWGPEHRAYVRSGPQVGRLTSDDPVRVLRRRMTAEAKRLRSMLNRTSGTPREPEYEPIDGRQMGAHIARSVQIIGQIAEEHRAVRRRLGRGGFRSRRGGGGTFWSLHELHEAAKSLRGDLTRERRRLKLAWERYERRAITDEARRLYKDVDERERLSRRLVAAREEADVVAAEIEESVRLRVADPPLREWSAGNVRAMLTDLLRSEGRLPTKTELNTNSALPYYTTVRRLLGPAPLTSLANSARTA